MVPFVIGIAGISGSGKTFYINQLKNMLNEHVCVISFDDYYKPLHEQKKDENDITNFDLPDALFHEKFAQDLMQLIEGHDVLLKKYNFENYEAPERVEIVSSAPIIIAEGLFIFDFPHIDKLLDYRIFMEADLNISLDRRLKRDTAERGIPEDRSLYQWHNHVMPSYNNHILPHKQRCELVIKNHGPADENLVAIKQSILNKAHPSVIATISN